jgi:hypothetical protein
VTTTQLVAAIPPVKETKQDEDVVVAEAAAVAEDVVVTGAEAVEGVDLTPRTEPPSSRATQRA